MVDLRVPVAFIQDGDISPNLGEYLVLDIPARTSTMHITRTRRKTQVRTGMIKGLCLIKGTEFYVQFGN